MAWPNTPLTTYNFDAPPPIKASDLNAFQDAINQIINGTYAIKSIYIDGSGGSTIVSNPGTVYVSNSLTVPSIFSQAAAFATGRVLFDATGAPVAGQTSTFGCTLNYAVGLPKQQVQVIFNTARPNAAYRVLATIENNGGTSYSAIIGTKATTDFLIDYRNPITGALQSLALTGISFVVLP